MEYIGEHDGVRLNQIISGVNIRRARIDKALSFLTNDGFIRKDGGAYYITPKKYLYDREHYDAITAIRRREMEQMKGLSRTDGCYSRYIVSCLDDKDAHDCGHCANCNRQAAYPSAVSSRYLHIAEEYVNGLLIPIEPRKMWENSNITKRSKIQLQNQPGLCLSKYGDAGYGELVRQGKYAKDKRFCEELVGKSSELLKLFVMENGIRHLCCVPSLRSGLVKDFAVRLAASLGITFLELLEKSDATQQKNMENSAYQCANAYRSFTVKENIPIPKNILLVDDIVDSRWTLTVCGCRLMEAGAEKVFPFALADSSNREV